MQKRRMTSKGALRWAVVKAVETAIIAAAMLGVMTFMGWLATCVSAWVVTL